MFIDDRKRNTKKTGKRPCTASVEPVRSAAQLPSAAKPRDRKSTRLNSSHTLSYTTLFRSPFDHQRAHRLDEVGDRIDGGDPPEPVRLDQVARHVHRRQEEKHEKDGEETLHRLSGAGAQRGPTAERRKAQRSEEHTSELQSHTFLHDALPISLRSPASAPPR